MPNLQQGAQGPREPPQQPSEQPQNGSACSSSEGRPCDEGACGGGGGDPLPPPAAAAPLPAPGTACLKCRKAEAEVVARGREPLCHPCLHEQLLAKVRHAARVHGLVQPGDRLALAFSGGRASAALLRFLALLRNPRTDRPARGQVSYSLHIIHVDKSAALGRSPQQAAAWAARVAAAVQPYLDPAGGGVQYHRVPLEAAFSSGSGVLAAGDGAVPGAGSGAAGAAGAAPSEGQAEEQLRALLAAVRDVTGRSDLVRHLRTHVLLRAAAELGCGRLARGDCATALATHIVAAASKGCGYSLPGDVHLLDDRHRGRLPSVILPLREVSAREVALVCSRWGVPTAEAVDASGGSTGSPDQPAAAAADKRNINDLAAAFVAGMEAHNPGSVPNILNTISKLQAFPWNELPPPPAGAQQQRRQQAAAAAPAAAGEAGAACGNGSSEQQWLPAVLCPICLSPLADDELPGSGGASLGGRRDGAGEGHTSARSAAAAGCCWSCYQQVLGCSPVEATGGNSQALENGSSVVAAMPAAMQQQVAALVAAGGRPEVDAAAGVEHLRSQIAEFLLE